MPPLGSAVVVFDLDGTLAETAGDLIATLNVILKADGARPLLLNEARPMIGAGARALIERGFAASGRGVTRERLEELYVVFLDHYAQNICRETRLYPGAEKALRHLAQAGFRLAVCTNKVEAHAVSLLEQLNVAERFHAICGRDTFPYIKPDPRHLTMTVEQAGGCVDRAVMVGDSRTDFVTAQAAGIPTIAVPFGYTDVPVSELGPDRIIDHFDQLLDAVHAVKRWADAA